MALTLLIVSEIPPTEVYLGLDVVDGVRDPPPTKVYLGLDIVSNVPCQFGNTPGYNEDIKFTCPDSQSPQKMSLGTS